MEPNPGERRSGYVRYVTTRYGNLVDRFSISNQHVANAVEGYGVPRDRIRVIYTGVDPDDEFSPERAEPVEELPSDRLQILFAGRLVPQKDPRPDARRRLGPPLDGVSASRSMSSARANWSHS